MGAPLAPTSVHAAAGHANAELSRRLSTPKPTRLCEPTKFESEAAERAKKAQDGEVKVVGVVVNRVASAREIFDRLPGEPFEDKVLLTGRIRPWDRDELLNVGRGRMPARKGSPDRVGRGKVAALQAFEPRAAATARGTIVRVVQTHRAIAPSSIHEITGETSLKSWL